MRSMRIAALLCTTLPLAGSCAMFGANLPPGRAGGTFLDVPVGVPKFSDSVAEHREKHDDAVRRHLTVEVAVLRDLLSSSTALREQLRNRQRIFLSAWEKNDEVGVLDAELVLDGAHWMIELDLILYNLWAQYRAYLPYGSEPDPYAPAQGANVLSAETRTKGGVLALAAEIVRMDNARVVVDILGGELALTQWLNKGDESRGIPPESFDRVIGGYLDPDHREHLQAQLQSLDEHRDDVAALAGGDGELDFLLSILRESDVVKEVLNEGPLGRGVRFARTVGRRSLSTLLTPVLDIYIAAFFADPRAFSPKPARRLANVPGLAEQIDRKILPLDVIFIEEARFDAMSQGYTKVALFLGDARSIRSTRPEDDAILLVHGSSFRRGRVFVEVDDAGIHLRTLDELLAGEDCAVIRVNTLDPGSVESIPARDDALSRALHALVDTSFTNPPPLSDREHGARLLWQVFGDALGVIPAPGRTEPSFTRIIDGLVVDGAGQPVLVTDGTTMVDGDAQSEIIVRHKEGDARE